MDYAGTDAKLISVSGFFAGKNVLVTGSTGFLAKTVVEKFLRDLPEVGQVYLLIRPKIKSNGARIAPEERVRDEILANSAFRRLRAQLGDDFQRYCDSKITCVPGDLTEDRFGLSEAAYEELAGKVDVVINSAATVVFDERLDLALNLNTFGPMRLLELARAAEGIYVHISTAYVCGQRTGRIEERLMAPLEAIHLQMPPGKPRPETFDVRTEISFLQELAGKVEAECRAAHEERGLDSKSEEARSELNGALVKAGMDRAQSFGWNDTYTFTKFLGEQLVFMERGAVPTVIVRPSIIESSLHEPEPGWLDGLRMADPIILGFGKGRLADFPASEHIALDIIPADFVVNGIMAATAHIARHPGGFDLFHLASSMNNPLIFRQLYVNVREYFQKHSFMDKAGRPIRVPEWKFPSIADYRKRMINRYLRPARLAYSLMNGRLPIPGKNKWRARLRNVIGKVEQLLYYVDLYGPYANLDCRFDTGHAYELLESIHPDERARFDFDPRKIRWRNYLQDVHIPGLKRNILRMDDVPRTGASQGHLLDEEQEAARKRSAMLGGIRRVPQTIVDLVLAGRERFGGKPFAEIERTDAEGGREVTRLTFEEIEERSGEWARRLVAKLGLQRGDRIALLGENGPEWGLAYLAIVRAGGTAVPLDRTMAACKAAELIKFVEAKAMIVSPSVLREATAVFGRDEGLPPCLNLLDDLNPHDGEEWPLPEGNPKEVEPAAPTPEMPASILFTSGTTLNPKGVVLTHSNFVGNVLSVAEALQSRESDRFLSVLPMHHAFEFTCGFLIPLYGGCTVHYVERLDGGEILETMKRTETTVMLGVPRLFQLFMERIKSEMKAAGTTGRLMIGAGHRLASFCEMAGDDKVRRNVFKKVHKAFGGRLRLLVSGGAALDTEIFHFFKRFGFTICEGYGLTETAPVLTVNPLGAAKAGSVGLAVPGVEIRIKPLDGGELGEVLARGPSVMSGYWRNPAATREVFEEGWFRTGDAGRLDSEGYLYLAGRLKDGVAGTDGMVYPDEIEMAFRGLPRVKEFCVLGLPRRSGSGEEAALVIVPEAKRARQKIEAAVAKINRRLPGHQRVARVEFRSGDLPRTSTLKVQRHKIRRMYLKAEKEEPSVRLTRMRERKARKIEAEVASAVAGVAGTVSAEQVTPNLRLEMDLGLDSIGRMDVLQQIETRMGLSLPDEVEDELGTVRDVITVVQEAVKTEAAASEKRRRASRPIWEHAAARRDELMTAMRETLSRRVFRGAFDLSTGLILRTYLPVSCEGLEHLPGAGPFILAANHCSHIDSAAIRKVLGKRASDLHVMAAKDYFFNTRFKGWFFSHCLNALPLDREDNAAESLAVCKAVLDHGRSLLLYPEGTRSVTGQLQLFKAGIGVLAVELDVPLIPVHLSGTFESLPKGRTWPRPGRVHVRIGRPVDLGALRQERGLTSSAELYRRAAAEIRAQVEQLARDGRAL